ncbi:MAG: gephyrin-like molybdotransferase Glp [Roseiarcus sp.]|jgi:molybdopterin molybdotransferase|uniref:molybdopterin molybdotransferase MoeA n=1 Tax=Roseiarcus sp. TaxID=1969460 RepID=UPI003C2521EA
MAVGEALERVLASVAAPTEREAVALAEAYGRTLASDVVSRRIQPPFANSAMDGYALRAADAARTPARLTVVGESAAGRPFGRRLGPGEAARIFTGAPLPEGADAVAMQETTRREGATVILEAPVALGDHVRAPGGDFDAGEIVLRAGRRLSARDVALAAAADHPTLVVHRCPRVAILASGDELVAPGAALGPAQIVSSNTFAVAGIVVAAGGAPIDLGIAADDSEALVESLSQAIAQRADVLVTLGGASVGDRDLTQQALVDAGMELGFWRVGMRPGKPLIHGRLGATIVLGLPGNPTSSTLCAVLFLQPLIRALLGDPDAGADPSEPARLALALPANGPRRDYMRATLARDASGLDLATPIANQDASLVQAFARADALLVREPNALGAAAGEMCRIIRLAPLGA